MKKFLSFILLFGCLSLCMTTSAEAQTVTNNTDCEISLYVQYAQACDAIPNSVYMTVDENSVEPIPMMPPNAVILQSKGAYSSNGTPFGCGFHIGRALCGMFPQFQYVSCSLPCGDYTATLISDIDIELNN